jgi:hypothetical protein
MKKIIFLIVLSISNLCAFNLNSFLNNIQKEDTSTNTLNSTTNLSELTVNKGLKEALRLGVNYSVKELSKPNGYLNNKSVKILLPENLQTAEKIVRKFGGDKIADNLINAMNSAATQAAPKTASIFINAIDKMTITDAKNILSGDDTAATKYFEKHTKSTLKKTINPIIEKALKDNSVASYYKIFNNYYNQYAKKYINSNSIISIAKNFGADKYIPNSEQNIENYVVEKSISGLFKMIAIKESQIRKNSTFQTTSLLKKVFSK